MLADYTYSVSFAWHAPGDLQCGYGSRAQWDRSLGVLDAPWHCAGVHRQACVLLPRVLLGVELWEMLQRQKCVTPVLLTGTLHIQKCGFARIKTQ